MRLSKRAQTAFAAAGLITMLACGTSSPSSSPAGGSNDAPAAQDKGPTTVTAGEPVNITTTSGDELTVTIASPKAPEASGNQFLTPKKGHFFSVIVTVEFKKGTTTYFANPTDLKLVGADGSVYQAEIVSMADGAFDSTQLNTGQKTSGKVLFDVPKNLAPGKGAKIQFEGSWDGKAAAYWTV